MDVICVVCGHKPEAGESVFKIEKLLYNNGMKQMGTPVMICANHCPQDIYEAVGCGGYIYRKRVKNSL